MRAGICRIPQCASSFTGVKTCLHLPVVVYMYVILYMTFANKKFYDIVVIFIRLRQRVGFLVHVSKTTTMAEASLKRQTTSQPSLSDAVSAETVTEKPVQKSKRPAQKPAASSSASLEQKSA